jgi:hypothetical protein
MFYLFNGSLIEWLNQFRRCSLVPFMEELEGRWRSVSGDWRRGCRDRLTMLARPKQWMTIGDRDTCANSSTYIFTCGLWKSSLVPNLGRLPCGGTRTSPFSAASQSSDIRIAISQLQYTIWPCVWQLNIISPYYEQWFLPKRHCKKNYFSKETCMCVAVSISLSCFCLPITQARFCHAWLD